MWLKGSNKISLATLALAMGCSDQILPDCDTQIRKFDASLSFKATKYDQNQNLFSIAEIFPCGFGGFSLQAGV